jgi:selenocysteine lyase/cysteine desulfurase
MNLDRRSFLQGLGAGALGAALTGCNSAAAPPAPVPALPAFGRVPEADYWRAVRAQFPLLLDDPVYLNTGGLGPTSQPVLDTVYATMNRLQAHSEHGHELFTPARATMAKFFGATPAEVCFTRNATEGNSIIAAGLALQPGDEVIFESHAHPGGSFPWVQQGRLRGVKVKIFDPDPTGPGTNLDRIRALVTPRTRVIQVSHITCTTGLVFPVRAIAEFAQANGIWFHIDGAQSAGMIPLNLPAIGCDSYAFSGHKWLGGPHESGVLYLRHDRLENVAVTAIGAHSGALDHLPGTIKLDDAASRHEYGTRNAGLVTGLAAAVRFQETIGRDRIAAHGRALATHLLHELAKIPDITVLTPRHEEMRASITTFAHARADAGKMFGYLREHHHLRCRPVTEQGLQAVRISTHLFNSPAECERVIAGVRDAARQL